LEILVLDGKVVVRLWPYAFGEFVGADFFPDWVMLMNVDPIIEVQHKIKDQSIFWMISGLWTKWKWDATRATYRIARRHAFGEKDVRKNNNIQGEADKWKWSWGGWTDNFALNLVRRVIASKQQHHFGLADDLATFTWKKVELEGNVSIIRCLCTIIKGLQRRKHTW
jgi:hypothetical protein